MADERDEQEAKASQETAVGHSILPNAGEDEGLAPGSENVVTAGGANLQSDSSSREGAPSGAVAASAEPAQPGEQATEVFFSRDETQVDPSVPTPPTPPPPSYEGSAGATSPAEADRMAADQEDAFAEKPHVYVAGAFVGAFVFAQILKRITGGGD